MFHAKLQANILGLKHILVNCDVADPAKEAELVKDVVKENKVDAVILGGVGLQITQLESVQKALLPLNVEVFASHAGDDHGKLFNDMIERGYEIMITQVAGDGLVKWLGKTITKDNFNELEKDSIKYGFHLGGEGGYYDSYVLDAPFFNERVNFNDVRKVVDGECTGHLEVHDAIKQLKVKL